MSAFCPVTWSDENTRKHYCRGLAEHSGVHVCSSCNATYTEAVATPAPDVETVEIPFRLLNTESAQYYTVLASELSGREIGAHITLTFYGYKGRRSYRTHVGGILQRFTIPEYDDGGGVELALQGDETVHVGRQQRIEVWS